MRINWKSQITFAQEVFLLTLVVLLVMISIMFFVVKELPNVDNSTRRILEEKIRNLKAERNFLYQSRDNMWRFIVKEEMKYNRGYFNHKKGEKK